MPKPRLMPKTADDVKAYLMAAQHQSVAELVAVASEERLKTQTAERALERLKSKITKNPNFLREGFDRAMALAGETPAETLVRLLHQRDENGRYALDVRERTSIAKALLPYSLPAFKAAETRGMGDVGVTVVVQNFGEKTRPPQKRAVDVEEIVETDNPSV